MNPEDGGSESPVLPTPVTTETPKQMTIGGVTCTLVDVVWIEHRRNKNIVTLQIAPKPPRTPKSSATESGSLTGSQKRPLPEPQTSSKRPKTKASATAMGRLGKKLGITIRNDSSRKSLIPPNSALDFSGLGESMSTQGGGFSLDPETPSRPGDIEGMIIRKGGAWVSAGRRLLHDPNHLVHMTCPWVRHRVAIANNPPPGIEPEFGLGGAPNIIFGVVLAVIEVAPLEPQSLSLKFLRSWLQHRERLSVPAEMWYFPKSVPPTILKEDSLFAPGVLAPRVRETLEPLLRGYFRGQAFYDLVRVFLPEVLVPLSDDDLDLVQKVLREKVYAPGLPTHWAYSLEKAESRTPESPNTAGPVSPALAEFIRVTGAKPWTWETIVRARDILRVEIKDPARVEAGIALYVALRRKARNTGASIFRVTDSMIPPGILEDCEKPAKRTVLWLRKRKVLVTLGLAKREGFVVAFMETASLDMDLIPWFRNTAAVRWMNPSSEGIPVPPPPPPATPPPRNNPCSRGCDLGHSRTHCPHACRPPGPPWVVHG